MTHSMQEIVLVIDEAEATDRAHRGMRITVKRSNDVFERIPVGVIIVWYELALNFFVPQAHTYEEDGGITGAGPAMECLVSPSNLLIGKNSSRR